MRSLVIVAAIAFAGQSLAQAPRDVVASSRSVVEQLYLIPLKAQDAFVSVETEYVEIGNPVMSTTVKVRNLDDPSKEILQVAVEFVGERLHHLYATGSLLKDPPPSYVETTLPSLVQLTMGERVGEREPGQKKGYFEYRITGIRDDPYATGGSSTAVFNSKGVLIMYGSPLPSQGLRLGAGRPN